MKRDAATKGADEAGGIFACDLHVHIGRSSRDEVVKVTAARSLTFENIARECAVRKGIGVVGIVDCASPAVIRDIEELLDRGEMTPRDGGGLDYRGAVTVIPGAEFETHEPGGGVSHHLSYFGDVAQLKAFSAAISPHVTNLQLSSQQCGLPARELLKLAIGCGAVFVPAHAFTPHKSLYGSTARRGADLFGDDWGRISAIELGLSADSFLADRIGELADKTFLSNSDAHSLPKIAREYQLVRMQAPTFEELGKALRREDGRRVEVNYGVDPRLGKYHRTFCEDCNWIARGEPPLRACEQCGSMRVTMGVLDRIVEIADFEEPQPPSHRAPYRYHMPLQFVPGVGSVTLNRLLNHFGTEMAVLHQASEEEMALLVGTKVAHLLALARDGKLHLIAGGGGRPGRAVSDAKYALQMGLPGM